MAWHSCKVARWLSVHVCQLWNVLCAHHAFVLHADEPEICRSCMTGYFLWVICFCSSFNNCSATEGWLKLSHRALFSQVCEDILWPIPGKTFRGGNRPNVSLSTDVSTFLPNNLATGHSANLDTERLKPSGGCRLTVGIMASETFSFECVTTVRWT